MTTNSGRISSDHPLVKRVQQGMKLIKRTVTMDKEGNVLITELRRDLKTNSKHLLHKRP